MYLQLCYYNKTELDSDNISKINDINNFLLPSTFLNNSPIINNFMNYTGDINVSIDLFNDSVQSINSSIIPTPNLRKGSVKSPSPYVSFSPSSSERGDIISNLFPSPSLNIIYFRFLISNSTVTKKDYVPILLRNSTTSKGICSWFLLSNQPSPQKEYVPIPPQ